MYCMNRRKKKIEFITRDDAVRILEIYPKTKVVYDYIKEHPNTDARMIADALGEQQVYTHVNRLEDYMLVTVQKQRERHYSVKHYTVNELTTEQTSDVPLTQGTMPVIPKNVKTRGRDMFNDNLREQYEALKRKGIFFDDRIEDTTTDMDFMLTINGVDCIPKGTLVAVSGEKGTGKSSVMAVFAGVLISDNEFAGIKRKKECNSILWIDTEKDKGDNRRKLFITRHIAQIADDDSLQDHGIDFVRMKGASPELLRYTIENLANEKTYDIIIIDGLIEMTDKPNDNYKVVIDLLMQLSEDGCTVFGMLHTSMKKGDGMMMYALGTHYTYKASTGFLVKKNKAGVITMSNNFSNDTDTIPDVLLVNEKGMIEPFVRDESDDNKDGMAADKSLPSIPTQQFNKILEGGVLMTHTELKKKLMEVTGKADRTVRNWITYASSPDYGILAQDETGKYYLRNES